MVNLKILFEDGSKRLMVKAGLDSRFTVVVHSTRAVATSTAVRKEDSIASIIKTAGWSNATTFKNYIIKALLLVQNYLFRQQF